VLFFSIKEFFSPAEIWIALCPEVTKVGEIFWFVDPSPSCESYYLMKCLFFTSFFPEKKTEVFTS
jgi:hypothetical protein